jgi:hypothetical protein
MWKLQQVPCERCRIMTKWLPRSPSWLRRRRNFTRVREDRTIQRKERFWREEVVTDFTRSKSHGNELEDIPEDASMGVVGRGSPYEGYQSASALMLQEMDTLSQYCFIAGVVHPPKPVKSLKLGLLS